MAVRNFAFGLLMLFTAYAPVATGQISSGGSGIATAVTSTQCRVYSGVIYPILVAYRCAPYRQVFREHSLGTCRRPIH
jgi:hypothetical protein